MDLIEILSSPYTPPAVFVLVVAVLWMLPNWVCFLFTAVAVCYLVNQRLPKPRKRKRAMSFFSESMLQKFNQDVLPGMADPIINGLLYFEELPEMEALKKGISQSFCKYIRFTSVPAKGSGCWEWFDRGFVLDNHFYEHQVASTEELRALIDEMMTQPLKRSDAPLWELHLIKNAGGESAINWRIHHALGDGISLMKTFLGMLSTADGQPYPMPGKYQRKPRPQKNPLVLAKEFLVALKDVLTLPAGPYDADLACSYPNKKALKCTPTRKVVYMPTVDLNWIKRMKDMAQVTVNDVMMCVTAGMLRRYCLFRGDKNLDSADTLVRAMLPLAFPRDELGELEPYKGLRNLWAFLSVKLLVHEADPVKRLAQTMLETNRLKTTPIAPIQMGVQNAILPLLPTKQAQQAFLDTMSRQTVVFSNVPGPDQAVFVAERELKGIQMVYPNLIAQIGILSYNNRVHMNMTLDPELFKDCQKLTQFYEEELEALGKALACPRN